MSEKSKYYIGVLIGRFEPFHNGHYNLVKFALENVNYLVIVLGSCNVAKSIKNPWNGEQRELMIRACFDQDTNERLQFAHASDYLYNDNQWLTALQNQLSALNGEDDYVLFGEEKDRSSYYLKMFPRWKRMSSGQFTPGLDATKVRELYFTQEFNELSKLVPEQVFNQLGKDAKSETYINLCEEYQFVQDYKAAWSEAPYPPTFVTVDVVVIKSGHVLCVRRKGYPGKGLYALPGGFVNQHERIRDAAIRELKEETGIALSKEVLDAAIVADKVFDHPDRSTRGRTITHAFCINLGNGPLPKVKGSDDADKAFWVPFMNVSAMQDRFYEDHSHIVTHFLNRY